MIFTKSPNYNLCITIYSAVWCIIKFCVLLHFILLQILSFQNVRLWIWGYRMVKNRKITGFNRWQRGECLCDCVCTHYCFIAWKSVINLELKVLFWESHLKLTFSEELIFQNCRVNICLQCPLLWADLKLVVLPSCIRQNNLVFLDSWIFLIVFFFQW